MDKDESSHYTETPKDSCYQAQTVGPWSCLLCLLPPLEGYGHLMVDLAVSSHSPLLHPQCLQSHCLLYLQVNKPLLSILSCLTHHIYVHDYLYMWFKLNLYTALLSFIDYIKELLLDTDTICGYCPLHEVQDTPNYLCTDYHAYYVHVMSWHLQHVGGLRWQLC